MLKPTEIRIPSAWIQKFVEDFTLSHRLWPGYSVAKIEHILRFATGMPDGIYYAGFDTKYEEAIFKNNPVVCTQEQIDEWIRLRITIHQHNRVIEPFEGDPTLEITNTNKEIKLLSGANKNEKEINRLEPNS